jgi:hypothetical protein
VIAFLVDQNFNDHIVDGLIRRGMTSELTHVRDARVAAGQAMPGVFSGEQ